MQTHAHSYVRSVLLTLHVRVGTHAPKCVPFFLFCTKVMHFDPQMIVCICIFKHLNYSLLLPSDEIDSMLLFKQFFSRCKLFNFYVVQSPAAVLNLSLWRNIKHFHL